jgi:antitoxin CcdA
VRLAVAPRRGFSEDASRKKPTNVSIDEAVLTAAKANGINLSQTLEEALVAKLRRLEQEKWLEENREALENYNRYIEKYGLFSEGRRRF